jgi:kumamolisin
MRAGHAAMTYTPPQVRKAYGFPANLDGTGYTIGIIELGGSFYQSDYQQAMALYGTPIQTVAVVGTPAPDPGGADIEVMLDACICGGIAPGAKIRVYFGPNTGAAFAQLIVQATNDNCDAISISWGGPEDSWSTNDMQAMQTAIANATAKGISVFAASGDNGSGDGESGAHVDTPASIPECTGCGGTTTLFSGDTLVSESGWSNGGGGDSADFDKPSYQGSLVNGSKRGVPDVSGPADPETGWTIFCNGQRQDGIGGTSAVAPMWAGIHVLLCQAGGKRFGWLNSLAYANRQAFRDILSGSNGAFSAGPGWDAVTGLGTPNGAALVALASGGTTPTTPPPGQTTTTTASPTPPPAGAPTLQQVLSTAQTASAAAFSAWESAHFLGQLVARSNLEKTVESAVSTALTKLFLA